MDLKPADYFKVMPERFLADKAGDMQAVIQFDVSGNDGGQWVIAIDNGSCTVEEGQADDPRATIRISDKDFLAVCNGGLRAMAAFLSGRIRVDGDINAVMRLRGTFK